jgi:DNA-binding response OmpR family regulator
VLEQRVKMIDMHQPTILLIEESEVDRKEIKISLEKQSFNVKDVPNTYAALVLALREPPDLILLNICLSKQAALKFIREVRINKMLCQLLIIAFSDYDNIELRAIALSSGCNLYLGKPFNFEQMNQYIHDSIYLRD